MKKKYHGWVALWFPGFWTWVYWDWKFWVTPKEAKLGVGHFEEGFRIFGFEFSNYDGRFEIEFPMRDY